jgi:hypothetical protein
MLKEPLRQELCPFDGPPLAAFALDYDTLGTPFVDLAKLHFLNVVVLSYALDALYAYPTSLKISFPRTGFGQEDLPSTSQVILNAERQSFSSVGYPHIENSPKYVEELHLKE